MSITKFAEEPWKGPQHIGLKMFYCGQVSGSPPLPFAGVAARAFGTRAEADRAYRQPDFYRCRDNAPLGLVSGLPNTFKPNSQQISARSARSSMARSDRSDAAFMPAILLSISRVQPQDLYRTHSEGGPHRTLDELSIKQYRIGGLLHLSSNVIEKHTDYCGIEGRAGYQASHRDHQWELS